MSDSTFPGGANDEFPGGPGAGQQTPSGTGGVAHPDYTLEYVERTIFYVSEIGALFKWLLSRVDGAATEAPTGATIQLLDASQAQVSTGVADLDPSPPTNEQALARVVSIPDTAGTYYARIDITPLSDGQAPASVVKITVK